MTITYAQGRQVQALLVDTDSQTMRVALPGDAGICQFHRVGEGWVSASGEPVRIAPDQPGLAADTRGSFLCPTKFGKQVISGLLNSPAGENGDAGLFYVFSPENRQVRIRILR